MTLNLIHLCPGFLENLTQAKVQLFQENEEFKIHFQDHLLANLIIIKVTNQAMAMALNVLIYV